MPSHHKHRHHDDPHPHLPDHSPPAADGDLEAPLSPAHSLESHRGLDADEDQQLHERVIDHHHNLDEMSDEEKIANLMQLNDALVKQVASSRDVKEELIGKITGMEEELQKVVVRADELVKEKNSIADEKCRLELEVAGLENETAALLVEKQGLLKSKLELEDSLSKSRTDLFGTREQLQEASRAEALAQENADKLKSDVERLEDSLSKSRTDLFGTREQLQEARRAEAVAQENAHKLKSDVERLVDKQDFTREIDALQAQNNRLEKNLKLLQGEKQSVEEELNDVRNACATAEGQVVDAKTVIDAVQSEVSSLTEDRDQLDKQLREAWQQIASLEAQQEASIAKHSELESLIKNLENDLLAVRNAHDSSSAVLEQERKAKETLNDKLAAAHARGRGLEGDLDSLKSSMMKLQDDSNRDQQRISSLEREVSSLGNEKASLEENKKAWEKKVKMLNSALMKASAASKTEMEKLPATSRDLEQSLADAKEEVSHRNENVSQLEIDLQELKSFLEEKSRLARLAWSVAAVSTGALAVVGISAVLRRSK